MDCWSIISGMLLCHDRPIHQSSLSCNTHLMWIPHLIMRSFSLYLTFKQNYTVNKINIYSHLGKSKFPIQFSTCPVFCWSKMKANSWWQQKSSLERRGDNTRCHLVTDLMEEIWSSSGSRGHWWHSAPASPPHTTATNPPLLSSIPQYLVSIANWNFKILV